MRLARGDAPGALALFTRNAELLEGPSGLAHEHDHDDALVGALEGIARSELAVGDIEAAFRDATTTLAIVHAYIDDSRHNVIRLDRATTMEILLGDASVARGDAAAGREAYDRAGRACDPLLERASEYATIKLHCGEAYAKLASQTRDAEAARALRAHAANLVSKLDRRLVRAAARDLPGVAL
jgi:hypothetical protein